MDDALLKELAKEYGTPLYVYDESLIRKNYRTYSKAFSDEYRKSKVLYACKANTNLVIMSILNAEGAGVDVVSGGELHAALKVGFKADDILYTNNSKTVAELKMALDAGVTINVDSVDELSTIGELAKGKKARISFRINPVVNPRTHPKIATGLKGTKFGIHIEHDLALKAYKKAKSMDNVEIVGVHAHIGSQITETSAFVESVQKIADFVLELDKIGIAIKFVDIGGGLGIAYKTGKVATPEDLAAVVCPVINDIGTNLEYEPELWLEPGRYIVGNSGILLTRVNSIKKTPYKNFINVDCGFNTLARPVMYDSYHRIGVVGRVGGEEVYDLAGNVCESGDILARDRKLPRVVKGDLIKIYDVGAYGFSMASTYNSQPLPSEVLVGAARIELIRERGTYGDIYKKQKDSDDVLA